jgi:hypothetical protein
MCVTGLQANMLGTAQLQCMHKYAHRHVEVAACGWAVWHSCLPRSPWQPHLLLGDAAANERHQHQHGGRGVEPADVALQHDTARVTARIGNRQQGVVGDVLQN